MKLSHRSFAKALLLLASLTAHAEDRPNIVLLMAEDLSSRIGAFGDTIAVTPNIDQLAVSGVRYTNVFTSAGVCAPSRAATIMGAHQISFGAQHMRTSGKDYKTVPPESMKAFPEMLRSQGYYTLTDGKLDYQFSGPMANSGPFTIWDKQGWRVGIEDAPFDQPFFAFLNFAVTHESGVFPPLGNWPHSITHFVLQVLRNFQGKMADAVPSITPAAIKLEPYYPDTPTVRADIARHYHNIAAMDAQVGSVITYLSENNLEANTIVVWTTDHGDGLPRAKRELYDSGLKVPLIIRWPDRYRPAHLKPGQVDEQLISFVDLAPTILAMAANNTLDTTAEELSHQFQGRNFLGLSSQREFIIASRDRIDEVPDRQRAIRNNRFKYIRSYHPEQEGGHPLDFRSNMPMMREMFELLEQGALNEEQALWFEPPGEERLFDLDSDPYELRDLSTHPSYQSQLLLLRSALDQRLREIGDSSDIDEDLMVERFRVDGQQGQTAPPVIEVKDGLARMKSSDNASIGYQLNESSWLFYSEPIPVDANDVLTAKAIRYGWQESRSVTYKQR